MVIVLYKNLSGIYEVIMDIVIKSIEFLYFCFTKVSIAQEVYFIYDVLLIPAKYKKVYVIAYSSRITNKCEL